VRFLGTHWRWFAGLALITALYLALSEDWWRPNHLPAAAMKTLKQADRFELLSLDPHFQRALEKDGFHGYRILDRVVISDPKTRDRLISALRQGMLENFGTIAACFNPRHGIHAVRQGKQVDLVICYECLQVKLFGDDQGEFLVSSSPQAFFNETLKTRGLASK
jgi:hypothetical protein